MNERVILRRAEGPRGEIVLARCDDGTGSVFELIVNGTFAMDSRETSSERELAGLAFDHGRQAQHILIGGLGLGYTAAEVLAHDPQRIDIVEIEQALVDWAREAVTPTLARVWNHPAVHLHQADLHDVLTGAVGAPGGPWDAILLDIDNGPDFLIHAGNARIYRSGPLRAAFRRLSPGGILAIWCQRESADLWAILQNIDSSAQRHLYKVQREGREFGYVIYSVQRPPSEVG